MAKELTFSLLKNDLDKVAYRWFELGIQLEIEDGDLNAIETDSSRCLSCLRRVIRYFLSNTDGFSDADRIKKLIKAMKSQAVGEIRHGSKLERELQPPLTLKKLLTALNEVAACWHSLGIQLDIPIGKLHEFETYSRDVKRFFSDMLAKWWKKGPKIEDITEALRHIDEKRLAGELEKKYRGYIIQGDSEGASDAESGYEDC